MNTLTPARLQQFHRSLALLAKAVAGGDDGVTTAAPSSPPATAPSSIQRAARRENAVLTSVADTAADAAFDSEQEAAEFFSRMAWEKQPPQDDRQPDSLRIVPGSAALANPIENGGAPSARSNSVTPTRHKPNAENPAQTYDNNGDNSDNDGSKQFFHTLPWDGESSE